MRGTVSLKLLLLLSLCTLMPQSLWAQKETVEVSEQLIKKGNAAFEKGDYTVALEHFTKAEVIASKIESSERISFIKNNIGRTYAALSNYGEALGYYKQALETAKEAKKGDVEIAKILNNISSVYAKEKEYESSLEYLKKGYALIKDKQGDIKAVFAANIADNYNKLGNFKQAQAYLLEVKDIPKSKQVDQLWKINYAESLLNEGAVSEAQDIVELLLADVKRDEIVCYICTAELLSRIYTVQGKTELAIEYAKKALEHAPEMRDRIELYDQLSELYYKKQDYATSKHYKNSVIEAKDSLSVLINRGLFESNKVKLKVQEYENEIKKYETERLFFIIGIVLSLLLFFMIYRSLKNRIIKQKQEKIIAENQQKIFALELESLKNNIAEKNRKLSAKALYTSGRNELVEGIIDSISKIPHIYLNEEVSNYLKTLKDYVKNDTEWDDFIVYFEQVNPNFLKTLQERHPQLLPPDIRFICYLYMNLGLREISSILNITMENCKKRKQRIAKKMGTSAEELQHYILKIN